MWTELLQTQKTPIDAKWFIFWLGCLIIFSRLINPIFFICGNTAATAVYNILEQVFRIAHFE